MTELSEARKQGWDDGRVYHEMLSRLERIEAEIETNTLHSIDGLKDLFEIYTPIIENMRKIYGESAVAEYDNTRKNIEDLLGE
jgi:hypothetical protein